MYGRLKFIQKKKYFILNVLKSQKKLYMKEKEYFNMKGNE